FRTVIVIILVLMSFGSLYETILMKRQARIDARQRHAVKSNNNEDIHSLKIRSHLNSVMSPVVDDKEQLKISDCDISGEDESVTVGRLGQVVLAFSALSNGRKILHCGAPPPDSLTCVHGLRFLSLAWVIMVHTYLQVFTIAENKMLRTLTERNFMFQTVSQATFSRTVIVIILVLMSFGSLYETILMKRQARIDARQRHAVKSNNNEDIHSLKIRSHLNSVMSPVVDDKEQLKISDCDISGEDESVTVGRLGQVVLAFSALSNGRKILHCGAPPPDSLTCVHGLRFLSLAWVIMVHTYLQVFTIAENKMLRTLTERNFMFQTVSQATFSVDTFFFISGLLVTYLYFKTMKKQVVEETTMKSKQRQSGLQVGVFKFFKLLGYRFIRLTPAYIFVLLMAEINMRWLRNISVFEPLSQDQYNCDVYWWRNVFYINSLFPMKDMCMLWSWYMSNDTQFYALAIIILLVSVKYFRVAAGAVIFFLISSWATTIMISLHYGYRARIQDPFAFFDELYDKPWTRLGPYLVGMFAGWFLLRSKHKIKMSTSTTVLGWLLSLATLFCLVYGLHLTTLEAWGSALYVSVGHTAWGAALAWIVIACCTGYGGCINSALSFRMLQPLSRLTYCAYLVHPVIMVLTSFQMDGPMHIHNALTLILYFGNVVASFLLSFCISLTLEAPIVRLLKITLAPKARRTLKEINE
ncbi:nose resistant to fluoxetine protein 6, partial [Diaphorina citri]|uniref:Nose resistant to fluoxetine protein 6 n=1 Tax=Diaphorina citri TaxID=121845 RepID=A0A1S3CTU2_DIACI